MENILWDKLFMCVKFSSLCTTLLCSYLPLNIQCRYVTLLLLFMESVSVLLCHNLCTAVPLSVFLYRVTLSAFMFEHALCNFVNLSIIMNANVSVIHTYVRFVCATLSSVMYDTPV